MALSMPLGNQIWLYKGWPTCLAAQLTSLSPTYVLYYIDMRLVYLPVKKTDVDPKFARIHGNPTNTKDLYNICTNK